VSGTAGLTKADDAEDRRMVLSDLLNRVLDRGLVVTGTVLIAVADVDLIRLDLNVVLTAVESAVRRLAGESPT
jgi:gas vesicle structural protein